jgi:hypothetical protein
VTKQQQIIIKGLNRTRKLLTTKGWLKGAWGDPKTGPCCLVAALDVNAEKHLPALFKPVKFLLGKEYALNRRSVPHWNDKHDTSKEDVLNLLDEAASLVLSNKEI